MTQNIGETGLRRTRRSNDPMEAYDGLPTPLRHWLSNAALPWSPTSARRIWTKSRAKGLSPEQTLVALDKAEAQTLKRERSVRL